ncbi:hypothetical protein ACQPYK_08745 [Streptosporangium sp. CA-135522]
MRPPRGSGRIASRERLDAYAEAGVEEVALVPVATGADPGGVATLKTLAG